MNHPELTDRAALATRPLMHGERGQARDRGPTVARAAAMAVAAGMLVAAAMAVGGCVAVNAPDKPIVIELNINIKQEVIYRLAQDAGNTINQNPEIF